MYPPFYCILYNYRHLYSSYLLKYEGESFLIHWVDNKLFQSSKLKSFVPGAAHFSLHLEPNPFGRSRSRLRDIERPKLEPPKKVPASQFTVKNVKRTVFFETVAKCRFSWPRKDTGSFYSLPTADYINWARSFD